MEIQNVNKIKRKYVLGAMVLMSLNVIADEQDIKKLNAQVNQVEIQLLEAGLPVTASELEAIKVSLVISKMASEQLSVDDAKNKFNLNDSETRQVVIGEATTSATGGGGGVVPPQGK